MALRTFKSFVLFFALFIATTHAATLSSVLSSLRTNAVLRCGRGCNKSFIKTTFNYLLFACRTGGCSKNFVLRTNPLGSSSHIQEFCVVSEPVHSPRWSMRIQADLIPSGARMVIVAVPRSTRTEPERFRRPFILSQTIPRNQLFIINQMVKAFCGLTV